MEVDKLKTNLQKYSTVQMAISAIQNKKERKDKGLEIGGGGEGVLVYIGWSW